MISGKHFSLLWWYLLRPNMYRDLVRRVLSMGNKRNNLSNDGLLSKKWCTDNEITRDQLLIALGLTQMNSFKNDFNEIVRPKLAELQNRNIIMGGGGDYELLYLIADKLKAKNVLETGVALGFSSLSLLLSVASRNGMVYSTDRPYPLQNTDKYVGYLVPDDFHSNWKLFRMPDKDGLRKIFKLNQQFDLIHYDSDKSRDGRLWAYAELWQRLHEGGVFISDDIDDNLAFKDFCLQINRTPLILKKGKNYLGVIKK
ncbi:MAG: class I SAM-dependent methyltransferase [Cyclobacteriaceae bacterium]|nr:class I SAM-dependent methyltransferase [Cyclobacteriaceae bacterium]